jgi:hypothetical protein
MDNETMFSLLRDAYNNYDDSFTVKVPAKSLYGQYQPTKEKKMTDKLYEISRGTETLYGHKLATNSQGQWVMEIKGTGDVIAVDKATVQEVLPYTIAVQFESGKQTYSYLAEAGKYQIGEFYIVDTPHGRSIVQVTGVDTKNASGTKQFTPIAKLLTE